MRFFSMEKKQVNINIGKMNHDRMMQLIQSETLCTMTMTKAVIVEIALSHLFNDLKNHSLNEYAIQHLQEVNKYEN